MTITIHALGFMFPHDRPALTDPMAYNDFAGKSYELWEARQMLQYGAYPTGLILQAEEHGKRGPLGVIEWTEDGQTVRLLEAQ